MTDKYDIGNRLFAHSCPCGAPLADTVFCADCRARFEATLTRCTSCNDLSPIELCAACDEVGEPYTCRNCQGPHHIQNCPTIWRALRDQPIPYAMAAAALKMEITA